MNWQRSFIRARTGKVSSSLRELYDECSAEERRLSPVFFERYPLGGGVGPLTLFEGILQNVGQVGNLRPIVNRPAGVSESRSLREALEAELCTAGEIHVAVSGGIDSWVLAALLKRLGYNVRGWYLESGVEGYCEREQVMRFREALHIPCEHIRVSARDFIESVSDFVAVTESPIYNLHPVSKLLLARGLARNGVTSVVTGDGADQVMRHDWDCDLLPLTLACFQSAGVRLIAPFISERVISSCPSPHADKAPLRELARSLGVPDVPKRPTLFPWWRTPTCLEYTTSLLLQTLETPCAASLE